MSVYLESNGTPRAATFGEVRDLFIGAVKSKRDEILVDAENGKFEAFTNSNAALADEIITGVLGVIEGSSSDCPGFTLSPKVGEEDKVEAINAGGNWIPYGDDAPDISEGVVDYFKMVNN